MYKPYVRKYKKVNNILIRQCLDSIYKPIVKSLMSYRKISKKLLAAGFKLNPYDTCVANRMVNRKHQNNVWRVEDCKLSHMDPKVNKKSLK